MIGSRYAPMNSYRLATGLRSKKSFRKFTIFNTTVILYETMNQMNKKTQESHEYKRQLRLQKRTSKACPWNKQQQQQQQQQQQRRRRNQRQKYLHNQQTCLRRQCEQRRARLEREIPVRKLLSVDLIWRHFQFIVVGRILLAARQNVDIKFEYAISQQYRVYKQLF